MVPAPAPAAILTDVLWCLGLGLLLGAVRDAVGLFFGNGRLRCFLWDLLTFAAAAVLLCGYAAGRSASGVARWYMAGAMAAGAVAWHRAVFGALYAFLRWTVRFCTRPLRFAASRWLAPGWRRLRDMMASIFTLHLKKAKIHAKMAKTSKKQLQTARRILYN